MKEKMKYKEIISRYVDGEVTSEERSLIEQILKEDKELYRYYQELKQLDSLLNEQSAQETSYDWEQKVQSALSEVDPKEGKPMKKQSKFRKSLQGGILVLVMILGLISVQPYIKRGVQGRFRSATDDIGSQYSPGYMMSTKQVEYWGEADEVIPMDGISTDFNTEEYARICENEFLSATDNPLSTFSIDVDTGSYSNIRRFLNMNQMPPEDAVRIEEMLNYFSYQYEKPEGDDPFSINIDSSLCPWNKDHQLIRIGLQGKTLEADEIPPSNLVFLIDVSGSMSSPNKLALLKKSMKMMVDQLTKNQRVAIVVYAGAAGQVLESTPGSNKWKIKNAIDHLSAGGSTAGGAGIKLAYKIAKENYIEGGNNRVILATDGDFNVGVSSTSEMTRLIEEKREEGVFITVLGVGMGNYKDNRLEQIANKGNGAYYYIDTKKEAKKVLVTELGSTLFTIAKDVKIQIEFNPAQVKAYRLIGYENRMLKKEDFNDDTKDAGELGAGHTVTALYEIVPSDSEESFGNVDELTYQKTTNVVSDDMLTVKLRYKEPDGNTSKLLKQTIGKQSVTNEPKGDFKFAAAVAEFGLILRDSKYKDDSHYEQVIESAKESKGKDKFGYRQEFIELVQKAQSIDNRSLDGDNSGESQGIQFKGGGE